MTPPGRPRLLVLGSGAVGSLFAARLARAGQAEVTLAGTWPAALETIAAAGIAVEGPAGCWTARVATADRRGPLPAAEIVLVAVKSYQTAEAAAAARRALAPGGLVVSLQNGLGNCEALAAGVGAGRVAAGVAYGGYRLLAPARVREVPGAVVLGPAPRAAAALARLAGLLRGAGLDVAAGASVEAVVWRKLAANCAINPLSALLGVPNGALLEDAGARRTVMDAAREVAAVAAARGIELGEDAAALALDVARGTASNRSSMLQDLERGGPTEIDALCGAVVREGQRLGVATPVNARLWRDVLARRAPAAGQAAACAEARR